MAKKGKCAAGSLESIKDLSTQNVWGNDAYQIAKLWEKERGDDEFSKWEDKILNTLRLAFEVVHYNPDNDKEENMYGKKGSDWVQLESATLPGQRIAIREKHITKLSDLSMQNIKFVSASTLLELINNNFGGGWDAVPNDLKMIIESAFDISTSQLPTSRIHAAGGSMERKLKAGFEVLEIPKGTWTEAIFARKKQEVDESLYMADESNLDDDDLILDDDNIDTDTDQENTDDLLDEDDDTYYSQYAEEANDNDDLGEEMGDGMHISTGEDDDI